MGESLYSVLGGMAGILSAVAAWKSASSANKSVELAAHVLRRAEIRDLVISCHEAVEEGLKIKFLSTDLIGEYATLFSLHNSLSSSRSELYKNSVESEALKAEELIAQAQQLLKDHLKLTATSDSDLENKLVEIESVLVKLRTTRESMLRSFEQVRGQVISQRDLKTR